MLIPKSKIYLNIWYFLVSRFLFHNTAVKFDRIRLNFVFFLYRKQMYPWYIRVLHIDLEYFYEYTRLIWNNI